MRSFTRLSTALLTATLLAGPALAQDDLDMGADTTPAEPQVGQTYQKEEVGDWSLDCIKTETGEDEPCQMTQLMTQEDGNPIATAAFFKTPEGSQAVAGATIMVPLETLLPAGLRINVDGSEDKVYNFTTCNRAGCVARVGFSQSDLNAFKAGNVANLTIRPFAAPDVDVPMTLSLSGFTAAFDKVTPAPAAQQ
ncbi:invasion associated locus B family protein [Pseudooceanicola sp. 200-1SW]|uniref:invasion associated locus B family protein n=1 Tax=Pseudooceanicola sp. 200-1SW TaxID=3425949 RepID=UPI003D7F28E1